MIEFEMWKDVFDLDNPLTLEYFELCSKATEEPKYFERHHILPKSIWPEYDKCKWNKVKLSYQDHYRAHELLPLICLNRYDASKMARAWQLISVKHGEFVDMTKYDLLRTLHKNMVMSDDFKAKLSKAQTGRKHLEETKLKIGISNRGKIVSEETRQKMRVANTGRVMPDSMKNKMAVRMAGEGNVMFGRTHTDDVKKRLREVNVAPKEPFLLWLSENTTYSMTGEYTAMSERTTFVCNKHVEEFSETPSRIMKDCRGCKQCTKETIAANKSTYTDGNLPLDKRRDILVEYLNTKTNLTLVSDFEGMWKPSMFQCDIGHKPFESNPVYVKRTIKPKRCPDCLKEAKKQLTEKTK